MHTTDVLWRRRLVSALRTVLACIIVGCTTLYGPESARNLLTFSAFSYVVTILIVYDQLDATLGDAVRGCWLALYASIQVMLPTMLILKVIGPGRITVEVAAVLVAVTTFGVAFPNSSPLLTKRIAFGQTVIVYIDAVIHGAETGAVMLPVHVAASTALGAVASVLAMLLPYPHLAFFEVRRLCRIYADIASKRLNLLVEAFSAQDNRVALDFLAEAKTLAGLGNKLLRSIKDNQEGMMWESPYHRLRKRTSMDSGEKLQDMDTLIRGMEFALTSMTSFPIGMIDAEIKDFLQNSREQIRVKLKQAKYPPPNTITAETQPEHTEKSLSIHQSISTTAQDLPAFFFLNCMKLLQDGSSITRPPECPTNKEDKTKAEESSHAGKGRSCIEMFQANLLNILMGMSGERLIFASMCSITLGLAVLLGLLYNKENGYWSGLTVAISFSTGRQPTFTVANARAQGTVMGSIYGVLCSFVFQKFVDLWLVPLLPWIIFASFLKFSRMYGRSGGLSAAVGALLILGRKKYGAPSKFAIARITEAIIGLTCLITGEVLLRPVRAATLAKIEISQCLMGLQDWIEGVAVDSHSISLRKYHQKLAFLVGGLETFVGEAELEPNFWFKPFHAGCYRKLLGSLSEMVDILAFTANQIEFFKREFSRLGAPGKDLQQQINGDIELYVEKIASSLKNLHGVLQIKSLTTVEKQKQSRTAPHDTESGIAAKLMLEKKDVEEIAFCFLQHSMEVANTTFSIEDEATLKSQMVLCLGSLGFCISSLIRETMEIEREITVLVKWENP